MVSKNRKNVMKVVNPRTAITLEVCVKVVKSLSNLIDDGAVLLWTVRQSDWVRLDFAKDTQSKNTLISCASLTRVIHRQTRITNLRPWCGMDVVQSEVKQLGGVVTVDSESGRAHALPCVYHWQLRCLMPWWLGQAINTLLYHWCKLNVWCGSMSMRLLILYHECR